MAQETAPRSARAGAGRAARRPDTVVATIDGQPITEADSTLALGDLDQQFAQLPPEQRRAAALSAIIEIRLLAAKAGRRRPRQGRRISSAASAFLQQRALHSALVEKEVAGKITDEEIRARYDKEIANTPPVNEVQARHILVKTKEEADGDHQAARRRRRVRGLAKEKSTDPSRQDAGRRPRLFRPGPDGAGVREGGLRARSRRLHQGAGADASSAGTSSRSRTSARSSRRPSSRSRTRSVSCVLREKYFALVKSAPRRRQGRDHRSRR